MTFHDGLQVMLRSSTGLMRSKKYGPYLGWSHRLATGRDFSWYLRHSRILNGLWLGDTSFFWPLSWGACSSTILDLCFILRQTDWSLSWIPTEGYGSKLCLSGHRMDFWALKPQWNRPKIDETSPLARWCSLLQSWLLKPVVRFNDAFSCLQWSQQWNSYKHQLFYHQTDKSAINPPCLLWLNHVKSPCSPMNSWCLMMCKSPTELSTSKLGDPWTGVPKGESVPSSSQATTWEFWGLSENWGEGSPKSSGWLTFPVLMFKLYNLTWRSTLFSKWIAQIWQ